MNSTRFIKIELWGIKRFKTNPATNAPIICSTPAISAKNAEKKTTDKTKIYWEVFSLSNLLKNQRAIRGIMKNMMNEKILREVINLTQKAKSRFPLEELEIIAKIISTAVSVNIVPPTVIATDECFERPYLLTIGYATKVCVANILAVSKLAIGLKCKT